MAERRNEYQQLVQQYAEQRAEVERLKGEGARLREEVAEWAAKYQQLVEQYGERQAEVERLIGETTRLGEEVAQWTAKHQQLVEQYGERQTEVERLMSETARFGQELAQWTGKHQQLVEQYGERQREVEKLHQLLKEITSSRWFRLASFYWRLIGPRKASGGTNPHIPAAPPDPSAGMPEAENANQVAALVPQQAPAPVKGERGERFDLLCLPIIDWDFRFQRPQQLASQFANHGHRVFYLSQKFHTLGAPFTVSEKAQRVWEVSLKGPKRNVYQDMMDDETAYAYFEAVDALRREHGLGATAVIVQLPFWWPLARLLRQRFGWPVIYDCMDYHAGFSTNRPEMLQQEDELLAGCDLVVVPSKFLQDHTQKHNPRVLVVPNACDFEHFAKVPYRPPANPPTIGYYGAIADWFDSDLVADLAELRPQWRFLLVGSTFTADTTRLSRLPNVELVGEKPYSEIPSWVAQMDCLIIPFKRTPLTDATNPVKFFEIMAAGKPLVSVPLPELAPYKDFVSFAENPEEFARQIENALRANGPELVSVRRAFAQQHTWEKRFEMLIPHVAAAFPKVSIVVVTYNNLDLTRQCLESVLTRTEWPNYELFVVDNGSTDGTPEYLWELASKDSRLRVICNPENRGFAAANNQALRLAEGEFLVLLNNDTVVPRGWLSGLVRHLSAHPDFGLVGPVTNWIGNEAQIPVGYKRLEDMPRWAEGYVREHDGEFFDISIAALFCAAMRRDTFLRVGELDERFGAGMFEDDDYAIRVREAGLRVVCVEDVFVHHHGKAAFKQMPDAQYQELFERNRKLFEAKWGKPWVPHRYRSQ
ncbi:MAG: glycosyltransferase [Acidobacteriota bacterium]